MKVKLLLLIFLASILAISAKWSVHCTKSGSCPNVITDITPIPIGSGQYGACIVGGYGGSQDPEKQVGLFCGHSQDLSDWTRLKHFNASSVQIALASSPAATLATTGLGFLNYTTHLMYSLDLKNAYNSQADFGCFGQDIKSIPSDRPLPSDSQLFAQVGTLNLTTSQQGLLVSGDSGKTFRTMPWDPTITYGDARYVSGFYASSPVLYISGGTWPSASSLEQENIDVENHCLRLSQHLCTPAPANMTSIQVRQSNSRVYTSSKKQSKNDGYYGVITVTRDVGQTWTKVFESTELYFNDIHCITQYHCVVVGENSGSAFAYVTFDSGKTWTPTLELHSKLLVSLFRVRCVDNNIVYITGGISDDDKEGALEGRIYKSVDGGRSWALETQIEGVAIIMGLNFSPDAKVGFAVGSTQSNQAIVARFDRD